MKALRLTEEQYAAVLKHNAKAFSDWSPTPKANKFGAEKTEGYDSKLEARRVRGVLPLALRRCWQHQN